MTGSQRSVVSGCVIAVAGTVVVAAFRAAIGNVAGDEFPLLPFVLSVMVSAWHGGLAPGLLATALGAAVGGFFFVPPAWSIWINDPADVLRLAVFLVEGVTISALCEALRAARRRAEAHSLDADEKQRQLEAKDRHKNEFLATLAHEIRNPLTTIRTALAGTKADGPDDASQQRSQEVIDRQVALISRLMDDLCDLSRISQGKVQLQMKSLEVADVLDRAVESSRHLIEGHRHRLDVRRPGESVQVRGDPDRLTQVVTNLLTNSAKYTPEGGHIRLAAEAADGEALVRVRDNEVGIPSESLHRIFDIGEQVERNLDRSEGGLGIGLSVVRRLVEMHGGKVAAFSDGPGHGCEFVVRLPLLSGQTPLAEWDPSELWRDRATPARRMLIVDDEKLIAEYFVKVLRSKGIEAASAGDGFSALDVAAEYRPDVVVLDLGIPNLSGYEVARRIREQSWARETVLIAMTGWDRAEDILRMKEVGFDHHLVKPVRPGDVLDLLDERRGALTRVD